MNKPASIVRISKNKVSVEGVIVGGMREAHRIQHKSTLEVMPAVKKKAVAVRKPRAKKVAAVAE